MMLPVTSVLLFTGQLMVPPVATGGGEPATFVLPVLQAVEPVVDSSRYFVVKV